MSQTLEQPIGRVGGILELDVEIKQKLTKIVGSEPFELFDIVCVVPVCFKHKIYGQHYIGFRRWNARVFNETCRFIGSSFKAFDVIFVFAVHSKT